MFRKFAPLRDTLLWFAAAGAASILTSTLLGITPVRLLLAPYPFEREAASTAAAAWLISAWFYWNIALPSSRGQVRPPTRSTRWGPGSSP